MPILQDKLYFGPSADVRGPLSAADVERLLTDKTLTFIAVRPSEPSSTWDDLNRHVFPHRSDLCLIVEDGLSQAADLSFLYRLQALRRLSATSSFRRGFTSIESIEALPHLEYLAIGFPSLNSFDVLNLLPPAHLRELRLADTSPSKPSLSALSRFTNLRALQLHGHTKGIETISSLKTLERLEFLNARLKSFDLLCDLPKLSSFKFALSAVQDNRALASLHRLRHLNLFQSSGFETLDALEELCGLQSIAIKSLANPHRFPSLAKLRNLQCVTLDNLKRLASLDELAEAPALERFLHLCALKMAPERYSTLLDHKALRYFTVIYGSKKRDSAIRDLAAARGKLPYRALSKSIPTLATIDPAAQ